MISQTETSGGAGQYGFYAVPKAVEPKKKYRDIENEYEDEAEEENIDDFEEIDDRQAANQRELQRDYYVDEAPYPEFKPKERGLDFGVQIENGDLFDYDLEVRPLIEIIVGRSVVSAINELQEQKEKEERRDNLNKYQKKRNAQLMVTQRLQAKHKRKNDEADRRKLQKEVFVKNQKQVGKKIIARKNTKEALLGFKKQLLNELEDAGYLRSESLGDLKIKYQEWLYEQIMEALRFQAESEKVAQRLVMEEQRRIAEEHQTAISAEMAKRKATLDQRQRVDKQNRQRKEKKRYRKWRNKLNDQRQPEFVKFQQLLQKYEQCTNLLKYADRSNGFSSNTADRNTIYIAGGLENFLLALIESSGKELSVKEIEDLLMKIMSESGREIQISLSEANFDKLQEVRKRMEEKKNQFMAEKEGEVKDLAQHISLDLSVLEAANVNIRSTLHRRFVQAFISIYLTVQPEKTEEEDSGELNDSDKKRLEFADKIVPKKETASFVQRLEGVNQILRTRFEILTTLDQKSVASEKKEEKKEEKEEEQQEYIDIFDGQGWQRYAKTAKRELNRAEQGAAAYSLGDFRNAFVFDERVLHYLQIQLQKLTEMQGGDKMKSYIEGICNLRSLIKKELGVYDGEVRWG